MVGLIEKWIRCGKFTLLRILALYLSKNDFTTGHPIFAQLH